MHGCNRFVQFSLSILLSCLFIGALDAQAPTGNGVRLFIKRDAYGQSQEIPPGTYQVNGKDLGDPEAKDAGLSVRVPKNFRVRFCEEKGAGDGASKCEEFGEGVHNLQSQAFTFIKVWAQPEAPKVQPALIVFEQQHWGGRSQGYMPGMYRSIRGEFGKINDNMVQSVIIAKGFEVRFCTYEGDSSRGAGDCEVHGEGRHNLRFANDISFFEIKDLSDTSPDDGRMPVILYEDGAQGGKMQGFDVGVFVASQGQFKKLGNDVASSIAVKAGFRATVCADEGTGGLPNKCEEFGPGKNNLKNKDSASYIKVSKDEK